MLLGRNTEVKSMEADLVLKKVVRWWSPHPSGNCSQIPVYFSFERISDVEFQLWLPLRAFVRKISYTMPRYISFWNLSPKFLQDIRRKRINTWLFCCPLRLKKTDHIVQDFAQWCPNDQKCQSTDPTDSTLTVAQPPLKHPSESGDTSLRRR